MARSMWTGVISFGMVTIPVKLHTATESHGIAFHLLHKKCDTRIKELRWCPHCDKQVDWDDIVKGYEYAKGRYVELTDEDFEKLPLPSKHTIDLAAFVDEDQIDPIFYDSSYYVSIDEKGAQKAYKLLVQVMESRHVQGVASITFRNKERMCALRAVDGRLVLHSLLYEDEIKKNEAAKPSASQVSAQEKKMAESLIDALHSDFEPGNFKDTYQAALKKLINAKLKGKSLKDAPQQAASNVTDLMDALRASIEKAKKPARAKASKKAATKPAPSKKRGSRRTKAA